MSNGNGLRPRPGPAPKLIQGPKTGQQSLYQQQVLDEDTYTDALSHIITRDFFPNLPHLHATNDYLRALASNDPELLSSSIRRLARIAQDKEGGGRSSRRAGSEERDAERARRREFEMAGTPYIGNGRTPIGARGWDTPRGDETIRRPREAEDVLDMAGPSRPSKRRKPVVRDDLTLDKFQRNFTSEDNASFVHIVEEENRVRREEVNAWAFKVEKVAEDRRLAGEERRRMILDAATSGSWRVDANGRRLIGGLSEPGQDRSEGEAWKSRKLITAGVESGDSGTLALQGGSDASGSSSSALVKAEDSQAGALIRATDAAAVSAMPPPTFQEEPLPESHPLSKALEKAGLPRTALVSNDDGKVVPYREDASGSGDGRGRGAEEKARRDRIEREVMGGEKEEEHAGKVDSWKYKAMNSLMYPPDAYEKPFRRPIEPTGKPPANPPTINHRSTRINDDDDEPGSSRAGSRRGSSPARSWVDAAVRGTPYVPRSERNGDDYSLLPHEADPEPEELPPLMTWGTLLATPRALDGSNDPLDLSGPTFRLPETKHRDDIGRKLGAKAGKSMRERAAAHSPRPSSLPSVLRSKPTGSSLRGSMGPPATPQRQGNLTPAAKNLLDRSLGRTPQRSGLGFGSSRGVRSSSGFGKTGHGAKGWEQSPAPR